MHQTDGELARGSSGERVGEVATSNSVKGDGGCRVAGVLNMNGDGGSGVPGRALQRSEA